MVKKLNQIVIKKVENGFIISTQQKFESINLFSNDKIDKSHYIAKNEEDLINVLKPILFSFGNGEELKDSENSSEEKE